MVTVVVPGVTVTLCVVELYVPPLTEFTATELKIGSWTDAQAVWNKAVTLVPDNQVVTTQRAADLLGMSRPFFIKLLETGAMAHHRVGNQRRVYLRDVLEFARKRDEDRRASLDCLSRQAFEAGMYDRNVMPEGGRDE